ncbi:MAG TPA: MbcA/ParS/Xre antitoxin family protein [Bryobacteraceae bacterium]|jgi:hypothetical protein
MTKTFSRLIGAFNRVAAVTVVAAVLHAPALSAQSAFKPLIPRVWDDVALADWAAPVAGLNVRPTHISAKEYCALSVDNRRTYPVYYSGREPEGYWEMLQHAHISEEIMKVVPDQLVRRIEADFESIPPALMAHAVDTFGDLAKARAWLTTPNPVLSNLQPIEIANTSEGAAQVEEVLTRIDYGIFS